MYIIIYIKFKFLSLVEESDVQGVPKKWEFSDEIDIVFAMN